MAPNADRPIVKMRQSKKRKAQVRKSGKAQGGQGRPFGKSKYDRIHCSRSVAVVVDVDKEWSRCHGAPHVPGPL
jgi:hypothetical protein